MIPRLKQSENSHRQRFESINKRFAHNLIKFQTRFKGNFSRLISDSARERPFSEFQEEVRRRIEANTNVAAQDVCQMSHRAVDLDAQIDTLRVISGYADTPSPNNRIRVNSLKTIFRLTNPFVEELSKRGVKINVNIAPVKSGSDKVLVDPSLFNAAIWQLLDNASKYVLDNTLIDITSNLSDHPQKLQLSMQSVCIDPDEEELIFLEGRKGRHAGKKGENGIGLYVVRKALDLMGAKISARNTGFIENRDGFKYCSHQFIIEFTDSM
jgi:signal transduction histidine kinase